MALLLFPRLSFLPRPPLEEEEAGEERRGIEWNRGAANERKMEEDLGWWGGGALRSEAAEWK